MYGFEFEDSMKVPVMMQGFLFTIGIINTVILNPIAIYILISRKNSIRIGMWIGHIFLHINHVAQDIFFCFLYQPYPLLPLPVVACMGVLCGRSSVLVWLFPTLLTCFLSASGFALLYLLLRVQQALQPKPSRRRLSARQRHAVLLVAGALLSLATIAFALHTTKYKRRDDAPRTVLLCNSRVVMLIIALVHSIKGSVRERQQALDTSRGLLLRTWRIVALKMVISCVLYLLPGFLYLSFALLPPLPMPAAVYCICRAAFMICIASQSTASSIMVIMLSIKTKSRQYATLRQIADTEPYFSPRWIILALTDRSSQIV